MTMNQTPRVILTILPLALAACTAEKDEGSAASTAAAPAAASAALDAVFQASVEGEPAAIHRARVDAGAGDELVLKGRVMGSSSPFVEGRAAFIIGDEEKLTACSDNPGDECETPWDNCCDSKELKQEGIASIQVLGPDGRVLREGIEGVGGLEKLSRVVVSGTVAEGSGADNLVINAKAIRVTD